MRSEVRVFPGRRFSRHSKGSPPPKPPPLVRGLIFGRHDPIAPHAVATWCGAVIGQVCLSCSLCGASCGLGMGVPGCRDGLSRRGMAWVVKGHLPGVSGPEGSGPQILHSHRAGYPRNICARGQPKVISPMPLYERSSGLSTPCRTRSMAGTWYRAVNASLYRRLTCSPPHLVSLRCTCMEVLFSDVFRPETVRCELPAHLPCCILQGSCSLGVDITISEC